MLPGEVTLSAEESASAQQLRRNFLWFAFTFSVNHGVVTSPLVIATSLLPPDVGYLGNALLNVFTVLSTFSLGVREGRCTLAGLVRRVCHCLFNLVNMRPIPWLPSAAFAAKAASPRLDS
mmetsp:Transcript_102796/g.329686  ORF Transcript_102796/g.329686 Transcript_102796/m.329686 type:complete len:120 (+) Transcript_102796:84-443(+)